ncbi:MAG: folylpolyglutamate synthase/dihydrofolate synthase family protein [Pirellulales bacterium]
MSDSVCPSEYANAIEFLMGRLNFERVPPKKYRKREYKLERMRYLLDRLGNPQQRLRIVHIAGTKGKGSTTATLAAISTATGMRVGAFMSPHLDRVEQRIAINGEPCSPADLVQLVARIRPVAEAMDCQVSASANESRGPTYFELNTALALLHFADQRVDLAILEVGMGGRLDSTNVCLPICSAITSISYDHMKQLGNTLEEIAAEKAGIIKQGIPVVSGVTASGARRVIAEVAANRHANLVQVGEDFKWHYYPPAKSGGEEQAATFDFEPSAGQPLRGARLSLLGRHQAANAAVALAIVGELEKQGFAFDEEAIRRGLADVRCPARIELVHRRPNIVVDAAHNVASVEALLTVLDECVSGRPRILVFASTRGKDVAGMLQRLVPEFDRIILTRYQNNPRAIPTDQLAAIVEGVSGATVGKVPAICHDPVAAWQAVRQVITPDALVCITGSFFIAAEMRDIVVADVGNSQPVISVSGG